jgi:hypothetical protein
MQSCYLEQIKAAIVRQDPVSLNHRIAAWLSSYFDILFATNASFTRAKSDYSPMPEIGQSS